MNKYDNKEKYRYTFKTKKKRRNHLNLSSSSMHKNYSKLCVIILKHACPFSKIELFLFIHEQDTVQIMFINYQISFTFRQW